ncbi:hypothetical protein HQ447_18720 [bacterium]|nr:hypothetical protein [bacterium]
MRRCNGLHKRLPLMALLTFVSLSLPSSGASGEDPTGGSSDPAPGPPTPADLAAQAFEKTTYAIIPLAEPPNDGLARYYRVSCITDDGEVDFTHYSSIDPESPPYWQEERLLWWQGQIDASTFFPIPDRSYNSMNRAGRYTYYENLPDIAGENAGVKGYLVSPDGTEGEFDFPMYDAEITTQKLEWENYLLTKYAGWSSVSIAPLNSAIVHSFFMLPLEDGTSFGTINEQRKHSRTRVRTQDGTSFTDNNSNAAISKWAHWGVNGTKPTLFDSAPTLKESYLTRSAGIYYAGGMGVNAFCIEDNTAAGPNGTWVSTLKLRDKSGAVAVNLGAQGFEVEGWWQGISRNGHLAQRQTKGCVVYQYPSAEKNTLPAAFGSGAGGTSVQVNDVGDLLLENAMDTSNAKADMLVRKFTDSATHKIVWAKRQFSDDTLSEGWSGLQISALANAQPLAKQRELEALTPPAYPPKPEDTPIPLLGGTAMKGGKQYPVLLVPMEVTWSAIAGYDNVDTHVDPWTNKANGKRIFPDFKDPDDTTMRDKLKVNVKTNPALVGRTVFIKAFDVDDSTAESIDHGRFGDDSTPPVIDTDNKGNDNLDDYKGTPINGQFWTGSTWGGATATGTVDVNGETKFVFGVGMQPGNNYRVVASVINESMYTGVQTSNPEAPKYLGPELTQNGSAPASSLLTVWRRLWVENDSMEAIDSYPDGDLKNDLTSDIDSPTMQQVFASNDITTFYIHTISDRTSFTGPENSTFKFPGTLDSFTSFQTIPNMSSGVDAVQVPGNKGHIQQGAVFRLYDDDGFGLAGGTLPRNDLVVDDVIKRAYKPAFIEVMDARQWNLDDTVDLYRNHPPAIGSFLTAYDYGVLDDSLDANLEGNENLWCTSIMVAYQPGASDNDPNTENDVNTGATVGDSLLFAGKARVSIIYSEVLRDLMDDSLRNGSATIQDYEQRLRLTAAHEIGHQPLYGLGETVQHEEDGLMADGGHNALGASDTPFAAKSVKRFRDVHHWRQKEK